MASGQLHDDSVSETQAAQAAAEEAVQHARKKTERALTAIKSMDKTRLTYIGCLAVVALFSLIFNMASFSVGVEHAVSETTAQAQRVAEAKLNAWSYSAFASSFWGKLIWVSAIGGIGLVIWSATSHAKFAWVPLAQVGLAALSTLLLLLLFFVGFPDLSAYSDATCSTTILGYWVPLLAAGGATFVSAKPLLSH